MPLRKKQEVCGKPTQYNLQTCEYAWQELPDTHCVVPGRVRANHVTPSAQVQPSDVARVPRSPSPAPLPSKPTQEHFSHAPLLLPSPRLATPPVPLHRDEQPPQMYTPQYLTTPAETPVLASPANNTPSPRTQVMPVPAWSHDELRRLVCTNEIEAHYSYLPPRA